VIRTGYDEQLAGRGAGIAVFKRHLERDEVVVLAVNEQDRNIGIFERLDGGVAAGRGVQSLLAQKIGDDGRCADRKMQVLPHHVLPDRTRRGVGRVGDHAVHRGGENIACGHEHRRPAERHAHKVNGQAGEAFGCPVCPVDAVVALGQAEADVVALALVLRALLHIEHAALLAA